MRFPLRSAASGAFRYLRAPSTLTHSPLARRAFTTAMYVPNHHRRGLYNDLVVVYTADELRDQAAQLEQEQTALNTRIAELEALVADFDPYIREDVQDALVVASRVAGLKRAGHIALGRAVRAGGSSSKAAGGASLSVSAGASEVDVPKADGSVGMKRYGVIASHYVNGSCHKTGPN